MASAAAGPSLRVTRVIHAAMLASLVVYAAVVHVLRDAAGWRAVLPPEPLAVLKPILYALGAGMTLLVFVLRGRWLSAEAAREVARRQGPAAAAHLQARTLVLLALAEAVGIYGLILFLLGGRLLDFYLLWGAAVAAQLALVPREETWHAAARAGLGGSPE